MPNVAMKHEKNPRDLIIEAIGDLSEYNIGHTEALVVTYRRPEKTIGGIVLARSTLEEDLYQSKAGLIVRIGAAFNPKDKLSNPIGLQVELHDWVVLRPSDAWALEVNGVHCRHVFHDTIRSIIPQPGMVW